MSTPNIIQNLAAGDTANVSRGMAVLGQPVTNNQGVPASGAATSKPQGPLSAPGVPAFSIPSIVASGAGTTPLSTLGNPAPIIAGVPSTTLGTSPIAGVNNVDLNKQLTDTFGKGEGSLLSSEISNLGSDDSSYMKAYEDAMAQPNAENLTTLNTTLGNEGVSGNSSTAAIANADFQTGITSQEGLQEQQLEQTQIQDLLSLTEGLQGPSAEEVSSGGFLNDLGAIAGDVGAVLHGGSGVTKTRGSGASPSAVPGDGASSPQEMALSDAQTSYYSEAGMAIPTQDPDIQELL